ncbi:hypothetical protein MTO96_006997 [Rhipicephalus appendiculatus]
MPDDEEGLVTRPAQGSRNTVAASLTFVPNITADMVTIARWKQWPQPPVFHEYRGGRDCVEGTTQIVVGSDDLLSADVYESSGCLHVQLHGMEVLHRYFVAIDVQLCGETSKPDHEIATYVAPQPNLLDGSDWAKCLLSVDLTVLLKERLRNPATQFLDRTADMGYQITARILQLSEDCWPAGVEPVSMTLKEGLLMETLSAKQRMNQPAASRSRMHVTSPSDHPTVSCMSLGPYSFNSPMIEPYYSSPWLDEFSLQVPPGQDLIHRTLEEEPAAPFSFQETSQSPYFENYVSKGFPSEGAFCDGHMAVERGRTNFYRDLESEASLRLSYLGQHRRSTTGPLDDCCRQCSGSSCDKRCPASPFTPGIFEENPLDKRYAYTSAGAKIF